jgi:hypothetical protein
MHEFLFPTGLIHGNPPSWYAVVRPTELRAPSYDGIPRPAATGALPRILILEPGDERDAFVSEYAEDLGYITDSWFATREEAVEDADRRFGDSLGPWMAVAAHETHPESFVLGALASAR